MSLKQVIGAVKKHKVEAVAAAATILAGPKAGAVVLAVGKGMSNKGDGDSQDMCAKESKRAASFANGGRRQKGDARTAVVNREGCFDENSDLAKCLSGGWLGHLGLGDSTAARKARIGNRELVNPPPPGTPLLVGLGVSGQEFVEHSGIYLGDGCVAELRGDGKLVAVSLDGFLKGSLDNGSLNPRVGSVIFAACDKETLQPVCSASCVANARKFIAEIGEVKYDVKSNNCHMFTNACVVGHPAEPRTWLIRGIYTIRRLVNDLSRELNGGAPVVWCPVRPGEGFPYVSSHELNHEVPKE